MRIKSSLSKSALAIVILWSFLASGLPLRAQGDLVTSTDISGGSSIFVFRDSRKAKKSNFVARRSSKARRSASQKRATRRNVVSQSRTVAKRYRSRRNINTITPEEFRKVDIQLARKSPQDASKIFAGAAEYFLEKESDNQKAAEYLEQAIELDPTNVDAKLAFSELSVTIGNEALDDMTLSPDMRRKKALGYFKQAVDNDPKNALAFVGLGQVYDDQNDDENARINYETALGLDQSLSEVKAALGFLYYGEGRIDEADTLIEEALDSGEDSAEIQYFLGLIRYKQGDDKAAEAALYKSISIDPGNSEAYYYMGAVLNRMGDANAAIEALKKATELDPKFVNAWFDLGVTYYNTEQYRNAIDTFNKADAENTNGDDELRRIYAETFANLAETYRQIGEYENAITKYRLAVSLIKDDADLYSTFGFVLGKKGSGKDAITNFEKAVEVNPDTVNYANLGWALMQSAIDNHSLRYFDREKVDLERAKVALAQAVAMDGNNVAAQLNLGSVLNDLGQSRDAVASLERANSLRKDWLPVVYELGEAYFANGDYDNAARQFSQAIKIDNNFVYAYFNLGRAEHMRGRKKEAKKAQDELRKRNARLADTLETFFVQNRR